MTQFEVRQKLLTAFQTALSGVPTVLPNRITPVTDALYATIAVSPVESLGTARLDVVVQRWFVSVVLRVRAGAGEEELAQAADSLVGKFSIFDVLDGLRLDSIPSVRPSYRDGDWCAVPIKFDFINI
jgi:hypothetical protein